jgi:hypothetical protein
MILVVLAVTIVFLGACGFGWVAMMLIERELRKPCNISDLDARLIKRALVRDRMDRGRRRVSATKNVTLN